MTWEYFIIPVVALFASLLTFFSGFGLGTILTPAFALFFPIELAIAMTAIVHFLNNVFKFLLIGKNTRRQIFIKFGAASFVGALVGSWLLITINKINPEYSYSLINLEVDTSLMRIIIGILIIGFSLFELVPYLRNLQFPKSWFIPGGILSGFFGGVSGHQGALRSAFLIKYGLTKEQFIATGIAIALVVDMARITVYGTGLWERSVLEMKELLGLAMIFAFAGAALGRRLLKKVKLVFVQQIVGAFLLVMGLLISLGIV